MRWRLSEIPLREKSFRSQFILCSDQGGSAALEPFAVPSILKIESLYPTDPPR
jgi:hypothetical protein